ncbi:hypothetical protein SEPCBS119000_004680 [Sporothrix epigloea]|uniref:Uncharacterized protein n=1 Tax=Sporothrix epigloea TaxID=1892477 RepID=A0ABP0DTF2_9PEZI
MASAPVQGPSPLVTASTTTATTTIKKTEKTIVRKRAIAGRGQPGAAAIKPLGVIFVATKAPFLSIINRTVKLLDKGPGGARWSSTKVLPLEERISAVSASAEANTHTATGVDKTARSRSVLLIGTGHATTKLVQLAAWFQRQPGYVVAVRTRSSETIDDVFTMETTGEDDNEAEEDGMEIDTQPSAGPRRSIRRRNVNCLEVAVRLK